MKKISEETRAKVREAIRHPITWAKGEDLPEERIRPWEYLFQFTALTLNRFAEGFANKRGLLYEGMGKGKIPPNMLSVTGIVNSAWDVINDPLIGSYMDRRHFGTDTYRWIMRVTKMWVDVWSVILLFDFGLTPMQRAVFWCAELLFRDVLTTANTVAESKIWAGITPSSEQRGKVQLAKTLGNQTGMGLSALSVLFMGLKDVLGITDYQIILVGALVLTPLALFGDLLPSFAKQRVSFERAPDKPPPTLREGFAIVRHNKMFIVNSVCSFITVFTPAVDSMLFYRFLMPRMQFRGKEVTGELILLIKQTLVGAPGVFTQPFARQAIKLVGGDRNMLILDKGVGVLACLLPYFVGYKTFPRLLFMSFMDMLKDNTNKWKPVAESVINYEMLDYVEWKTGERSEGVTMSVSALLNKLVTSNIGRVTENAYKTWSGYKGWDFPKEEQPKRFFDTLWPMMMLTGAIDNLVWAIGLLFYRHTKELQSQVEAELIERRRLAAEKKAEIDPAHEIK